MRISEIILSEYGSNSTIPSPINRMMTAFAEDFRTEKDINLGVGYVNEATIPRELILNALREVLAHPERYPTALNYGNPKGSQNLIDSIKRFLITYNIGGLSADILDSREIIIGPSGSTSLLEGIASVIKPGIVITSDPMYYIYCNFLERRGFEIVAVPEDNEGIRTDLVRRKLQELGEKKQNIRFFYVVTVGNPTSTILSDTRRAELVEIVTGLSHEIGRKIPLFFDNAYENLIHNSSAPRPQSGLLYDTDNLVYAILSLSKILAPALRVGCMIGSDSPFLRAMIQKTSDAGFSAPLITQEIAGYLLDHHVADQIDRVNEGYRIKARLIKTWIDEYLGRYLSGCTGGQAGFYFYLTFRSIQTTEESPFFRYLARTTGDESVDGSPDNKHPRALYIPGEFCVHPRGELVGTGKRQVRLSYGFEETDRIHEALKLMREAADYAESKQ